MDSSTAERSADSSCIRRSITTSGFYPVVVSQLWHWTGDEDLVRPFVAPALKALQWLDTESMLPGKVPRSRTDVRQRRTGSPVFADYSGYAFSARP